jgi:hypothetical protein
MKLITLLDHGMDRMFQSVELFSICDSFSLTFLPSPILRPCLCTSLDMVCLILMKLVSLLGHGIQICMRIACSGLLSFSSVMVL